jgi:hypothetical protein
MAQLLFAGSGVARFCRFMDLPETLGFGSGSWCFAALFESGSDLVRPRRAFRGLYSSHRLSRVCDPVERRAEIRQLDEREKQAGYPKYMHVCEQSDQAQDSDDFKLYFVRPVRDPFGQGMEAKKEDAEAQDREQQDDSHHDHENVGLPGSRDEGRQMMRSGGVN